MSQQYDRYRIPERSFKLIVEALSKRIDEAREQHFDVYAQDIEDVKKDLLEQREAYDASGWSGL